MTSVLASTEEGGGGGDGCERVTIFVQSRVPLGPGKFHVVVLVSMYGMLMGLSSANSIEVSHNSIRTRIIASRFRITAYGHE